MNEGIRPKVGVGVLLIRDNKILAGRRSNVAKHGFATWAPPGGHLEFFETFEQCAEREVLEETGLKITNVRFGTVTNDFFVKENKHYITVWMLADCDGAHARIMEPDQCDAWQWFASHEFPLELFVSFKNLINQGFVDQLLEKKPESAMLNL